MLQSSYSQPLSTSSLSCHFHPVDFVSPLNCRPRLPHDSGVYFWSLWLWTPLCGFRYPSISGCSSDGSIPVQSPLIYVVYHISFYNHLASNILIPDYAHSCKSLASSLKFPLGGGRSFLFLCLYYQFYDFSNVFVP